jgi:hypothetical protein
MSSPERANRRSFLAASTTLAVSLPQLFANSAVATAAPYVVTRSRTRTPMIVGHDDHIYEIQHDWARLPAPYTWQTTHNVAVDQAGNLYVIHEGRADLKEHPSIFVFDSAGKFIRAFGSQFQGGGHGIEVRNEGGTEFIYVAGYQQVKAIAKMDLKGNLIWYQRAPMESGVYAAGEDKSTTADWGRNRFMPTNFAFLGDGDFFVADGYGSFFIHRYDKDGNWKSHFGGPGEANGKFDTPHGIWIDARPGQDPRIVVADRAHHKLQFFSLDGDYLETLAGFGLPANLDTYQELLLVPELHARISILDQKNQAVTRLGDDVARITGPGGDQIRNDSKRWQQGKFVHPHDACFDQEGNIFVAEWVNTGRISRLRRR